MAQKTAYATSRTPNNNRIVDSGSRRARIMRNLLAIGQLADNLSGLPVVERFGGARGKKPGRSLARLDLVDRVLGGRNGVARNVDGGSRDHVLGDGLLGRGTAGETAGWVLGLGGAEMRCRD